MNNAITLVGHVGKDPSAKTFDDTGNKVVKFSIAVKEYSANSDEAKTLWLDVDAWNGIGDRVLQAITKGREVVVHGRLSVNTYSKVVNGIAVQMTKPIIKLSSFHLCGKKPAAHEEASSDASEPGSPKKRLASVKP